MPANFYDPGRHAAGARIRRSSGWWPALLILLMLTPMVSACVTERVVIVEVTPTPGPASATALATPRPTIAPPPTAVLLRSLRERLTNIRQEIG